MAAAEDISTILHVDMDAFFASVEERDDPTLKGKPVVVGAGIRGVVAAANYEARKYGIHSAMPVSHAKRLAPHAIFIPPDHGRYTEVSEHIMEIFNRFTPLVEPISLDEAFLDVTGSERLLGTGKDIGAKIRALVEKEQGITCSVGIATTKFVAKLASSACKPNGMLEIDPDKVLEFLHPLPVNAIWGVGPKTNEELLKLGLRTVADIAATPRQTLIRALGDAAGSSLYELAWGRDYRDVIPDEADKSISNVETFSVDIYEEELILKELLRMTEKASLRMRERGLSAHRVSIRVRFADFKTITRSKTLDIAVDGIQESYEIAKQLYLGLKLDRVPIRLVGISFESLVDLKGAPVQLRLGEPESGWRQATQAIDLATARFGRGSVRPARLVRKNNEDAMQGEDEE